MRSSTLWCAGILVAATRANTHRATATHAATATAERARARREGRIAVAQAAAGARAADTVAAAAPSACAASRRSMNADHASTPHQTIATPTSSISALLAALRDAVQVGHAHASTATTN